MIYTGREKNRCFVKAPIYIKRYIFQRIVLFILNILNKGIQKISRNSISGNFGGEEMVEIEKKPC